MGLECKCDLGINEPDASEDNLPAGDGLMGDLAEEIGSGGVHGEFEFEGIELVADGGGAVCGIQSLCQELCSPA